MKKLTVEQCVMNGNSYNARFCCFCFKWMFEIDGVAEILITKTNYCKRTHYKCAREGGIFFFSNNALYVISLSYVLQFYL